MIVIGIVGPPAGGKSTVARMLVALGAAWINADRLAHAVLRLPAVKAQLRQRFGHEIFDVSGTVNRNQIANLVFGNDSTSQANLEYIEDLVHPIARDMASRKLARLSLQGSEVVVIDAPLLIEANWHFDCDEVWCVEAPDDLRSDWIKERTWDIDELRRRERSQLILSEKRRYATKIINNSGDLTATQQQVLLAWQRLKVRTPLFPRD